MSQQPDFIDVSHWNGPINWPLVAGTGILGVIAKATDGSSYVDNTYQQNRAGALAAGLSFASYHYLQHGDADRQMRFYLEKATPRQGERVVIDYEEGDPAVTMADLELAVLTIRAQRPDLQITVYGASMLTEHCNACEDVSFLTETSLWAARYSEVNQPVVADPPWSYWSAWQFTDAGRIKGINGEVDLNTFNGSSEACLAWFGPVAEVIPEPPRPSPTPDGAVSQILRAYGRDVSVSIEPDGTISFWVDGQPWHDG
jgi:GH25 family lysozyme M1 (1,4-beta-N-acetylmuramidase)